MDGNWTLPLKPTLDPAEDAAVNDRFVEIFPEFRRLSKGDFVIDQVKSLTEKLKNAHSYCPATWTARAYNLLRMGFPDLAIGDAHKALILLDAFDSQQPQDLPLSLAVRQEIWNQCRDDPASRANNLAAKQAKVSRMLNYGVKARDKAVLIVAQALFQLNSYSECAVFLHEYRMKTYRDDTRFTQLKELAERARLIMDTSCFDQESRAVNDDPEERLSGSILPQIYPWSAPFDARDRKLLNAAQSAVQTHSNKKCYLSISDLSNSLTTIDPVERRAKVVGVRANKDFQEGELILVDRTFVSGISDPLSRCTGCRGLFKQGQLKAHECNVCKAQFCGDDCMNSAYLYHHFACNKEENMAYIPDMQLNEEYISPDTLASNSLLHRLYSHLRVYYTLHPLSSPILGNMLPSYHTGSPMRFSYINDIKRPIMMLRLLGTDIFKEHHYDTWIIQTIKSRVWNNVRIYEDEHEDYHLAINLISMFFNHSCRPNIHVFGHWSGGTKLHIKAQRPIKRGEELFRTYLDAEGLKLPYLERNVILKDWVGGKCLCERCKEEAAEMEAEAEAEATTIMETLDASDDFPVCNTTDDEEYAEYEEEDEEDEKDQEDGEDEKDQEDEKGKKDEEYNGLEHEHENAASSPTVYTNRYASNEILTENHPAMQNLQRKRPSWKTLLPHLNYETDIDPPPSPCAQLLARRQARGNTDT